MKSTQDDDGADDRAAAGTTRRTASGTTPTEHTSSSPSRHFLSPLSSPSPMTGLRVETSFGDEGGDKIEDDDIKNLNGCSNGSSQHEASEVAKESAATITTPDNAQMPRPPQQAASTPTAEAASPHENQEQTLRNTQQQQQLFNVNIHKTLMNSHGLQNNRRAVTTAAGASSSAPGGVMIGSPSYSHGGVSSSYMQQQQQQLPSPFSATTGGANNNSMYYTPSPSTAGAAGYYDEHSSRYFMSEPSISDQEEASSQRVRARHRLLATGGTFQHWQYSDDEQDETPGGGADTTPLHQQRPPRRAFQTASSPIPPSSPGNTSISSWDISPARHQQPRVFFQFTNSGSNLSSSEHSREGEQQQQQQPAAAAVVMERDPNNHGHRQIRINQHHLQPPLLQQQNYQESQQQQRLFPDGTLIFDCIESPSQPQQQQQQQRKASSYPQQLQTAPSMPTIPTSSSPQLQQQQLFTAPSSSSLPNSSTMQASSNFAQRLLQSLQDVGGDEDDSIIYKRDDTGSGLSDMEGSSLHRKLPQTTTGNDDNMDAKLPAASDDVQTTLAAAAESSLIMTFSDSEDDDDDMMNDGSSISQAAAAAAAASARAATLIESNNTTTITTEQQANNVAAQQQQAAAAADYSETQNHSTKEKADASLLPLLSSSSVEHPHFRGARRHSRPTTSDLFSTTAAAAAVAPPVTTPLPTTTAPTKRPPRAVYARTSSNSNVNNKSAFPLSSAAATAANAAAAAAITRHHRRVNSIDGEETPSSASAAANNYGNSAEGSGGNINKIFRHRRSRSGDAAAASLVTGCSDWKGMGSWAKGSFGIGTAASSDSSVGRRKSNKGIPSSGISGNVRHRRSRSGDAAAASLMTGGKDWKGMEMDNIPIPGISSSGSQDDDDESQSEGLRAIISNNTQQKQQQQQMKKNPSGGSSDVSSKGSDRGKIGTPPTPTTHRPPKPELDRATARASASLQQPQPATAMQGESSGLLPGGRPDHSLGSTGGGGYGSMPLTLDELHQQQHQQRQYQQQHYFAGSWPPGAEPDNFPSLQGPRRMSWIPSHPPPPPPPPHLQQQQFLAQIRNSHIGDAWTYSSADDCGIGFVPEGDDYEEALDVDESDSDRPFSVQDNRLGRMGLGDRLILLPQIEERYENRNLIGSYQDVLRPSNRMDDSPFANIGKTSAEKASRSVFFPKTMLTEEEANKLPTYICPRCKTLQRAFFSVSDAPKQMEGPGGYLALYFAIYVISSLFIFGLEEGWEPLDCVYFAVITLTSTGLGDFVPTTDPNKIICSIFIYFGVACIGLLLGTYIAGTLDDRAVRDATEKQIQSCPNCARIQTIKESAARRRPQQAKVFAADTLTEPLIRRDTPRRISEPIGHERVHFDQQEQHTAVYIPRHHHQHHQQINVQHTQEENPSSLQPSQVSTPLLSGGGGENIQCKPIEVTDSPATPGSNQQRSMDPMPPPPPPISSCQPHTPTQQVKQTAILGSPMTRQILARQKHSRHGSIDVSNNSVFGQPRIRKHSADIPSFHTPPLTMRSISELIPLEQLETAPSLPFVGQNVNYSQGTSSEDADDASSCTSSSSDLSTVEQLIDDRVRNMKAAKYVFLTLRQALVNSLIIIAVGCIGFWLIESFSLVDSWYFTTVLLTTVGYGDIVPVTRGGKLFATVYILVGGTVLLYNMSLISMIPLELRKRRIERAVLTQFGDHLDDAALRELATGPVIQRLSLSAQRADGLDECTREMFALAMLVRLGKVTEQDIKETFASFRRLDVNNEGVLNSKSIIAGMIAKRRNLLAARESGFISNNEDQPPPPPLSSMNPQTFQNTQQQGPVMPGYYGMTGNGPPLADVLPPYHYNGDPESGFLGRESSHDWTSGGAYWLQGARGGSSSFNSSNFSSSSTSHSLEDDTEDELLRQQGHALAPITKSPM